MPMTSLQIAKVAAQAVDQKKASDILLLDLTGLSDVCDYFLICTVQNNPQLDAVVDAVRQKVGANCGIKPISTEGRESSSWVLLDYGSLVVHVFKPEAREYFRLERLWGEAPRVSLDLEGAMAEPAWEDVTRGEDGPVGVGE